MEFSPFIFTAIIEIVHILKGIKVRDEALDRRHSVLTERVWEPKVGIQTGFGHIIRQGCAAARGDYCTRILPSAHILYIVPSTHFSKPCPLVLVHLKLYCRCRVCYWHERSGAAPACW